MSITILAGKHKKCANFRLTQSDWGVSNCQPVGRNHYLNYHEYQPTVWQLYTLNSLIPLNPGGTFAAGAVEDRLKLHLPTHPMALLRSHK